MTIIKDGVTLDGLRQPALNAIERVDAIRIAIFGGECTVTSTTEARHSARRSGHYRGDGVDFRTRDLEPEDRPKFADVVRLVLGDDYVVILEGDHLHTHWSPVYHEDRDPQLYTA